MKQIVAVFSILLCVGSVQAQALETYVLRKAVSNRDTIDYTRIIRFDDRMLATSFTGRQDCASRALGTRT